MPTARRKLKPSGDSSRTLSTLTLSSPAAQIIKRVRRKKIPRKNHWLKPLINRVKQKPSLTIILRSRKKKVRT